MVERKKVRNKKITFRRPEQAQFVNLKTVQCRDIALQSSVCINNRETKGCKGWARLCGSLESLWPCKIFYVTMATWGDCCAFFYLREQKYCNAPPMPIAKNHLLSCGSSTSHTRPSKPC